MQAFFCNFRGMKYLISFALLGIACTAFGQKKAELTFNVNGVCGMCESRIEKAYDLPGILNADWDLETKQLTVAYKTKFFSVEALHAIAANAGHDTDIAKASEETYAGLHGCCKYRDGAECGAEDEHKH